jgi:hypothetical protein
MPTIDLTNDELAAVVAAIRRLVDEDKFPTHLGSFRCAWRSQSSTWRGPQS